MKSDENDYYTGHMQTERNIKTVPLLMAIGLTIGMLGAAKFLNNTTIIFPEEAAITLGCWLIGEERSIRKPWQVVVLPTLAGMLGIGLNHTVMGSLSRLSLALIAVMAMLYIARSSIGPSISAALLPIVLNINSWVAHFTFVLTCSERLIAKLGTRRAS